MALQQRPLLNPVFEGDAILHKKEITIYVAGDTPGGLMVSVVKHADTRDIAAISAELEEWRRPVKKAASRQATLRAAHSLAPVSAFSASIGVPLVAARRRAASWA